MNDTATASRPAEDEATMPTPPTPPTGRPEPTALGGGDNQLTRITLNLTPRAMAALERMTGEGPNRTNSRSRSGPTKTDVINRGIQVLEVIQHYLDQNNGKLTIKNGDGSEETIYIL